MREIGSEFSIEKIEVAQGLQIPRLNDGVLVFSGRTAIEAVLNNEPLIQKALLPSYCCDSMIEPFKKAGIEVEFYSVNYDGKIKITLDMNICADCILWCNYFGYSVTMPDFSDYINQGGIIIEDITHSFFSKQQFHKQSKYLVASLRKWEPILCGGYYASRKNNLQPNSQKKPLNLFLEQKMQAMILKQKYLSGEKSIKKSEFMEMYAKTNKWLADNYSGLAIDEYSKKYLISVDYRCHRRKRIGNAYILYDGLKKHSDVNFLFPIEDMDCPLFVPVIIENGKRDFIRKRLIENDIYCPVHWPKPEGCKSNLYDIELSLVCDQRYDEEDMRRIVDVLCDGIR